MIIQNLNREPSDNEEILRLSLNAISLQFDAFIGACQDSYGKPKLPQMGDLMKAKACLPRYCHNALKKKEPA